MTQIIEILKIIVLSIYVLFLPGLALSYVFFSRNKVDIMERTALSFALSISVIPLITFYLNLLGVKITRPSVFLETLCVILISLLITYLRNDIKNINDKPNEPQI